MGIKPWITAIFVMLTMSSAWSRESDDNPDERYDPYKIKNGRSYEYRKKKKDPPKRIARLRQGTACEKIEKNSLKPFPFKSLAPAKPEENQFIFNQTPMEMDLYFLSFFPTKKLLEFRHVNKYWKLLVEDVLYREHRSVAIDVSKIKFKKAKDTFQFTLKIYDLQLINFKKEYQSKFKTFMTAFAHKVDVKNLSFSGNRFGERRLSFIFPFLAKFDNIEFLDFSHNHMQTLDLSLLSCVLPKLKHLKLLNLENNLISHFNSDPWVYYLQSSSNLRLVYCSYQCRIVYENRVREYRAREKVIVPSVQGTLIKLIFKDTPIESDNVD